MKSFATRWRRQRISRPDIGKPLHHPLNEEPEEFKITVNLVNENSQGLNISLCRRQLHEKSKKGGKGGSVSWEDKAQEGIPTIYQSDGRMMIPE